jgi:hypothetical protein
MNSLNTTKTLPGFILSLGSITLTLTAFMAYNYIWKRQDELHTSYDYIDVDYLHKQLKTIDWLLDYSIIAMDQQSQSPVTA